jgi:hypothetical protein
VEIRSNGIRISKILVDLFGTGHSSRPPGSYLIKRVMETIQQHSQELVNRQKIKIAALPEPEENLPRKS